jgi:hypothetical protein
LGDKRSYRVGKRVNVTGTGCLSMVEVRVKVARAMYDLEKRI